MRLNLKYWRTRRAMSIRDLAVAAKVSSQTIVNIEKYGNMAQPAVIKKLSQALSITIDDLVVDEITEGLEEKHLERVAA